MANPVDIEVVEAIGEALAADDIWDKVQGFAQARCRIMRGLGMDIDHEMPGRLVDDAVKDTALGDLTWDPKLCMFSTHLCAVVARRTWKMIARHKKFPHESISRGDARAHAVALEASLAADSDNAEDRLARKDTSNKLFEALLQAADDAGDQTVGLILLAFKDEVYARPDVAAYTSISVEEYDAGLKRMRRLLQKLPEELRDDAQEVMRGVG